MNKKSIIISLIIAMLLFIGTFVGIAVYKSQNKDSYKTKNFSKDKDITTSSSGYSTETAVENDEATETVADIDTAADIKTESTSEEASDNASSATGSISINDLDEDSKKAYLNVIQSKRSGIEAYSWQHGSSYVNGSFVGNSESESIAFADIANGSEPELIVISTNSNPNAYCADLEIYTLDEGKNAKIIYSSGWDYQVAGGTDYFLFLTSQDKRLYANSSMADESTELSYLVFEEQPNGMLQTKELMHKFSGPSADYTATITEYRVNENSASTSDYASAEANLINSATSLVMFNYMNRVDDSVKSKMLSLEQLYNTYDKAVSILQ